MSASRPPSRILNIAIENVRMQDFLERLDHGVVVTPNVDHLVKLQRDHDFYLAYQAAEHIVCDSKIVQIASRFLSAPLIEKISGSDLFPAFCRHHRHNPDIRIFLLGAAPGVAREAMHRINHDSGRELVVGEYSPPMGFETDPAENRKIVSLINQSGATVLGVGLGAPKQEIWIHRYREQLPQIRIFFAIGATIDFMAGNVPRAPKWLSDCGLEWLYRLSREPGRLWKRYLVDDTHFFWLLLKQRLGLYRNPWAEAT